MTLSAVPYAVISLAIFGMLLMVFGMVVDVTMQVDNDLMADPDLPYSSERAHTMSVLVMCFNSMAFVALMCAGIFLIMNGVQSQSGEI
jgi:hypothetical protein